MNTKEEKLLKVIELQKALIEKKTEKAVEKDEYDLMIEKLESQLAEKETVIKEQTEILESASKELEDKDKTIEKLVEEGSGDKAKDLLLEAEELIKNL